MNAAMSTNGFISEVGLDQLRPHASVTPDENLNISSGPYFIKSDGTKKMPYGGGSTVFPAIPLSLAANTYVGLAYLDDSGNLNTIPANSAGYSLLTPSVPPTYPAPGLPLAEVVCNDLPHVLFGENALPGGHARIADAGADGIEDVPFGIVGRVGDEVGRGRIEIAGKRSRLAVETSVAESAVHGVELHAILKILVGGGERVVHAGRVALHGSIHRAHRELPLGVGRFYVGGGREETKHGETESAEDKNENRDDDTEKEFAHETSGAILADGGGRALVLDSLDHASLLRTLPGRGRSGLQESICFQLAGFADHIFQLRQVVMLLRGGERDR